MPLFPLMIAIGARRPGTPLPFANFRSSTRLGDLRCHEPIDLGDGGVGRLLHGPLRAPAPGGDLLARVLADGPDGDLRLLAQLLDVPDDLLPLLAADRRDADADGARV